jgi:type IVB pilus formation R64 PilN family outer membrane protein
MQMKKIVRIGFVSGLLSLSGCAIQNQNDQDAAEAVNQAAELYENDRIVESDSLVSISDGLYISKDVYRIVKEKPLPQAFNDTVVYTSAAGDSVDKTISNLAKLTGVSMKLTAGAEVKLAAQGNGQTALVRYQGSLKSVLDLLVDKSGLYWTYTNGKVEVFAMETKVYGLDAPVGTFTQNNSISSSADTSASSSSGGGSSVSGNSSMDISYDMANTSPWESSVNTMSSMLSVDGKLTDNPSEGYITVIDNPLVQKKVADYIQKINDKANKKIAVRVDVYDVATSSTSDFGFNVDTLTQLLSDDVSIFNESTSFLNSDLVSSATSFTYSTGDKNVVLKALNTMGKTTEVTGATIYTVSGQPAPVQSVEQQNYLESIEENVSEGVATTSLESGTVVTGYNMMVTPRLQSNNQVYVNLNLQISTLLSLDDFSSGGDDSQTIQLPHVSSKNFLESMILHSGQSILIAGFQTTSNQTDTASPTSMDMWYASGGAKSTQKTINTTVIVITPYIIGD